MMRASTFKYLLGIALLCAVGGALLFLSRRVGPERGVPTPVSLSSPEALPPALPLSSSVPSRVASPVPPEQGGAASPKGTVNQPTVSPAASSQPPSPIPAPRRSPVPSVALPTPRLTPAPSPQPPWDFFPYGVYIGGGWWDNLKETAREGRFGTVERYLDTMASLMARGNFNVVWSNNMPAEADEFEQVLRAWLTASGRHGLRVIPQGGPFPGGTEEIYRSVSDWPALVEEMKGFWRKIGPKFKDDRTLLTWSLGEEPPAEERDRPIYEAIRALSLFTAGIDTNHPATFLYHWTDGVVMAARYVMPHLGSSSRIVITNIDPFSGGISKPGLSGPTQHTAYYSLELERRCRAAQEVGARCWVMGGTNGIDRYQDWESSRRRLIERGRPHSAAEIRFQVYAALLHRATGMFWFVFRDLDPACCRSEEYILGMVDFFGNPRDMYYAAAEVGKEIRPFQHILKELETGPLLYDYRNLNYFESMPDEAYEAYWRSIPVRWRSFKHKSNRQAQYWMAVNYDLEASRKAVPHPSMPAGVKYKDLRDGKLYANKDALDDLSLLPGGGTLFEVVP